jgi:Aspartyl protease
MRSLCALLVAGFAAIAAAAEARAGSLVDQPYEIGYGDRLATKVIINGQGPFDFLLDTASSRTIIYEHVRARLGVTAAGNEPLTVYGITGLVKAVPVRLAELRLSDERLRDLTVAALPEPVSKEAEPDGILGLDVLERYFVVLDRPARMLRFFARAASVPQPYRSWSSVALKPQRLQRFPFDFWYFQAQIGSASARTLFDLGAGVTILNWETGFRLGLHKREFIHSQAPDTVQDVLGKSAPVLSLTELSIEIGDRRWRDRTAIIADAPVFDILELADRPAAMIGPGLLQGESLAIDFENQRLYIAPETE